MIIDFGGIVGVIVFLWILVVGPVVLLLLALH